MYDKYEVVINYVKDLERESVRVSERLSEELAIEQGCEWCEPCRSVAGVSRHKEWQCKGPETSANHDSHSTRYDIEVPENEVTCP